MYRRATKIVATLGPASSDPALLEQMIRAGVNVVRLNFSHGTAQDHVNRASLVREAAQRAGAAHAVPLVTQPASRQRKRITRIDWFGYALVRRHTEFGTTAGGSEDTVRIEPRSPSRLALALWPLLRAGTVE